jgi:hypothetical protein
VALVAENVLSASDCEALIALTESKGYEKALVNIGDGQEMAIDEVRKSGRCMIDAPAATELLWRRVASLLPPEKGITTVWRAVGLNERLRFLRYHPGDYFAPHQDGRYSRTASRRELVSPGIARS